MQDTTTEFSFILKPSEHGIGVFAVHNIKEGTYLRLFREESAPRRAVSRKKEDVPEYFRQFCLDRGDTLLCPSDFGCMEIGWHLNHSKDPNAYHDGKYNYYALKDIKAGEEIIIDYNTLEEPEESKESYYK